MAVILNFNGASVHVGDIYRNEALAGDVYFIHDGLRLGSKG